MKTKKQDSSSKNKSAVIFGSGDLQFKENSTASNFGDNSYMQTSTSAFEDQVRDFKLTHQP